MAPPSPPTQDTAPPHAAVEAAPPSPVKAVSSESLFGGSCEVHIDHRGTLYRLRQTSLGKLILTK